MQTMMVQPPPAPAAPASGKTSTAKGSGLFEEMLGGQGQEPTHKLKEDGDSELLAAAAITPWPPAALLDGPPEEVPTAATPSLAESLPTSLAPSQGLKPGPLPEPNPALTGAQLQIQEHAQTQTPGLVQEQGSAAVALTPTEPASAPEIVAPSPSPVSTPASLLSAKPSQPQAPTQAGTVPAPANPAEATVVSQQLPPDAVVKTAAGPAAAAPAPHAAAELLRAQKGLAETSPLVEELLPAEPAGDEPLVAAGPKAGGLNEARFLEMLQGAGQSRSQAAALRVGGQRMETFEVVKETTAGAKAAASVPQFALDAAATEQADAVLPPSGAVSGAAAVAGSAQPPAAANLAAPPPAPALTLPSGQVVAENQVFGQVLAGLRAGATRDSSSISLKLNPEELGEVKLEMVVEKDRVRAMILAQSQQVQEVLERHLPRLREAMQQQGLKLEEVQVSVDSRQQESHRGFAQDHRQGANPSRFGAGRSGLAHSPELPAIAQAVARTGSSGLSIRI